MEATDSKVGMDVSGNGIFRTKRIACPINCIALYKNYMLLNTFSG
uniref:Uncharacterized protein n=1 Tax=Physcomitrium patens TaxID=3218 RepID=A0A2K1KST2_PHYPA|nr:hypothetical protein PHYPA_003835 [Physcomitrium patens]